MSSEPRTDSDDCDSVTDTDTLVAPPGDAVCTAVSTIMCRTYVADDGFSAVIRDVDTLTDALQAAAAAGRRRPGSDGRHHEALLSVSRRFVADSKRLVSSATRSRDSLAAEVNASVRTLASLVTHCHAAGGGAGGAGLTPRVVSAARAYCATLTAAACAAGRPLGHPAMKALMKRATSLASTLSALMRTLRSLDQH